MEEQRRSRRDFLQNIIITLLSLSAVLLFARTQFYDQDFLQHFRSLTESPVSSGSSLSLPGTALTAPVRVAVTGSYGRYGSITLTTASEEFSPLGALLGEVLGSAQMYTACTQEDFLDALSHPSVYYDFLTPLPLSILGELVGAEGEDAVAARHLVVTSPGENRVLLYLWDHAQRFLCCTTVLSSQDLEAVIGGYEQGNAIFAFDAEEPYDKDASSLHPLSLFLPGAQPDLPVLCAESTVSGSDSLLSALGFNPHTKTRWTEGSGTEIIVDGDRTLRISTDGSLAYQSGGSGALSIESAGEIPTFREAVNGSGNLLKSLLPSGSGGELYLSGISCSAASTTLTFDYQYGGVPIRLSSGAPAATVTLSGRAVSSILFLPRQYVPAEETALLLPMRQALAIAAQTPGTELLIGYADYGEERVCPQWLCE